MSRPVAFAFLAVFALPSLAFAKPADPRFSTADPVVFGDPDGGRAYRFTARDIANAPLVGQVVTLDFSGSPAHLYAEQEPGTTVNCASRTLSRFTGHDGVALFHPRFGGGCASASVVLSSDGIIERQLPARSTDLNGVGGCVDLADLSSFSGAFLHEPSTHPELDFDGSGGAIGLGDLVILAGDFLQGAKGNYCP
jgi:hypothetical protein